MTILNMEALTSSNHGGSNYILNEEATLKKLQLAAVKPAIEVTRNGGSTTIHFSTGSYVTTVIPLVNAWIDIKGDYINNGLVDNMNIKVENVKIKKDNAGTIEHYLVKLKVDGQKVTVTCFDTTLTVLVQAASMLEPYCSRALFPYLEKEIKKWSMRIKEYNHLVLSYDSAKPNTRRQHQKHLQGATALASSPRLRTLSSPGTPLEQQVAALQSPAGRREAAPLSLGLQLLEDMSLLGSDSSIEIMTLGEEVDSPVRSSTPLPPSQPGPAPPANLLEVITTRSQVLPDLHWMQDLNVTIETPPSPAPSLSLLSLQQQVRTLEQIPDPVEQAVEHLFNLVEAAVLEPALEQPVLNVSEETGLGGAGAALHVPCPALPSPALHVSEETGHGGAGAALLSLQPPLIPTPARGPARMTPDVSLGDNEVYINLGSETCTLCGVKSRSVKSLQAHFVEEHYNQSIQMLKVLERQQEILNTILAKQNIQEKAMVNISTTQMCVISDIKELKRTVESGHVASPPSAPPVPAVSPPLVTPRPAPPPPAALPGPPPALLQPPAPRPLAYADRVRSQAPTEPLSYADRVRSQAPTEPRAAATKKIAYITDSIGANVDIEKLEGLTKAKFKKSKAYAATKRPRAEGFKFPETNFTTVVPEVLAKEKFDVAVLLAPSVEITNLADNAHEEYTAQEASLSSYNIMKVAENALAAHPELKKVIVAERVPRYDQWHNLNTFANEELHEALKAVKNDDVRNKIVVGRQTLDCQSQGLQLSRYGDPRVCRRADGIHMRGSSGLISFTRSMASILAGAGLCNPIEAEQLGRSKQQSGGSNFPHSSDSSEGFRTQRGRGPAPRRNISQFNIQTQNQFRVLGN